MQTRQNKIDKLMRAEVASKSVPPAIVFAVFAILIFFYKFNLVTYALHLQVACVGVVLASLVRIWISREMNLKHDDSHWQWIRASVWLNTICWAFIFNLTAIELKSSGIHYVVAVVIMTCFVSSSLITLSYDKWLFFPFQILNVGPMSIICFIQSKTEADSVYLILGFVYATALLYQFRQYREYKKHLIQRFSYQIDLEDSFEALKISKVALVDQTLKLIHASKVSALGEMAGGLSHEVNNALQIVLGSIQQIERNLKKEEIDIGDYILKITKAHKAIQKIKTVIDGLRHFSLQMESAPKDAVLLSEIMERTLNFCHEMITAHTIRLEIMNIPELRVISHPLQITQILFTLLKNSFDALDPETDVKEKWIKVNFEVHFQEVWIRVTNGGPKVTEEIISKLFHPFFTTKDIGGGTGLSLSIAKGIAKDHSGDLVLDEDYLNTSFVLKLPIASK